MAQQSPSLGSPSSPPQDSSFTPRKEFIREQKPVPNSFAVLSFAASNALRLYSFSPSVVSALRSLFDTNSIISEIREDASNNFCEFLLDTKPWTSPKSVRTEKLLIDIIAAVYQCGYAFLSSVDYGRENDDRLMITFSKPSTPPDSRSPTPNTPPPFRQSFSSATSDKSKYNRVPFALSFISPTIMRVVSPPLHLTPAILQAVRASWPRGVVSEKKVGNNSFEFKLKGYKWFQQDTFATDSLRHILSLLSSLDDQAFTLLSSLSLTNRSRVRDLWVFTGQGPNPTDSLSRQNSAIQAATPNNLAEGHSHDGPSTSASSFQHRRFATEPNNVTQHSPLTQHVRASSDQSFNHRTHGPKGDAERARFLSKASPLPAAGVLRKPAPRAQVPVSVANDPELLIIEGIRTNLPSMVPSTLDNMTGVGTAGFMHDVLHSTSLARDPSHLVSPIQTTHSPKVEPFSSTPEDQDLRSNPTPSGLVSMEGGLQDSSSPGAELLGPGTFRDSTFSFVSDTSQEVSIKWTGIAENLVRAKVPASKSSEARRPATYRRISSPSLPGGWQPSPVEEKEEEVVGSKEAESPTSEEQQGVKMPVQEISSRMASPELTRPDIPLRKSEAAVVRLMTDKPHVSLPASPSGGLSEPPSSGQGWVLVNVERGAESAPVAGGQAKDSLSSPHAKAIAAIDALDNKGKGSTTPRRRFFSLRGSSRKSDGTDDSTGTLKKPESQRPSTPPPKTRSGFRDKLRLISIPEAARKEDKRRSID